MKRLTNLLWITCGTFFLVLGVIGAFLPLIPTTGPLLMAAFCYARSSPKFYHWLLNNRWFGPYIKNYREGRGMPLRSKITTLALLWVTIGTTIIFAAKSWWVIALLLAVAVGVTIHLVTLKTYRPESRPQPGDAANPQ